MPYTIPQPSAKTKLLRYMLWFPPLWPFGFLYAYLFIAFSLLSVSSALALLLFGVVVVVLGHTVLCFLRKPTNLRKPKVVAAEETLTKNPFATSSGTSGAPVSIPPVPTAAPLSNEFFPVAKAGGMQLLLNVPVGGLVFPGDKLRGRLVGCSGSSASIELRCDESLEFVCKKEKRTNPFFKEIVKRTWERKKKYYHITSKLAPGKVEFDIVVPAGAPPSFEHAGLEGVPSVDSICATKLNEGSIRHELAVIVSGTVLCAVLHVGSSPGAFGIGSETARSASVSSLEFKRGCCPGAAGTVDGRVDLPRTNVVLWSSPRCPVSWLHPTVWARVVASNGAQAFPAAAVSLVATLATPSIDEKEAKKASEPTPYPTWPVKTTWVVARWALDGKNGHPALPAVVANDMLPVSPAQLSLPLGGVHKTPVMTPGWSKGRLSPSLITENFRVTYELVVDFTSPRGPTDAFKIDFWVLDYNFDYPEKTTQELWGIPHVRIPVWVTDNPEVLRESLGETSAPNPPAMGSEKV